MWDGDLVVFDFDGTLGETRTAVSTTVNAALVAHKLPRVAPVAIWTFMGLPLETLFTKSLPPPRRADTDVDALVRFYRAHFEALGAPLVTPMPGAVETVRALASRGKAMAVATSRELSSLTPLLERFGIGDAFVSIGTCDRVAKGKPDPEMLALVLAEAGVQADRACMVGDTIWDIQMARALGVPAVGVLDGCHARASLEKAGADVVLETLPDLLDWVAPAGAGTPVGW